MCATPRLALMRKWQVVSNCRFTFQKDAVPINKEVSLSFSFFFTLSKFKLQTLNFLSKTTLSRNTCILYSHSLTLYRIQRKMASSSKKTASASASSSKFTPLELFPTSAFMPRKWVQASTFANSCVEFTEIYKKIGWNDALSFHGAWYHDLYALF